jgi:hypothetical protein
LPYFLIIEYTSLESSSFINCSILASSTSIWINILGFELYSFLEGDNNTSYFSLAICLKITFYLFLAKKNVTFNQYTSDKIWHLCKNNFDKPSPCHCVRLLAGGDKKSACAGKGIFEFETFNLPNPAFRRLRHISLCMKR